MADYDKLLVLTPKNAEAYYHRGIVKYYISDLSGSITDFTKQ